MRTLVVLLVVLVAWADSVSESRAQAGRAIEVLVTGSSFSASKDALVARVRALDGVAGVEITSNSGVLTVQLKEGGQLSLAALREAVAFKEGLDLSDRNQRYAGPVEVVMAAAHTPARDAETLAALESMRPVEAVEQVGEGRFLVQNKEPGIQGGFLMQKLCRSLPPCPNPLRLEDYVADIIWRTE